MNPNCNRDPLTCRCWYHQGHVEEPPVPVTQPPNDLEALAAILNDDAVCAVMDALPNYERGVSFATLNRVLKEAFARYRTALRAQDAAPVAWRDIETAPKDGEPVLLYKPDERMVGPFMLVGYWGEWPGQADGWIAVHGKPLGYLSRVTGTLQGYPTHWMPLPTEPTP